MYSRFVCPTSRILFADASVHREEVVLLHQVTGLRNVSSWDSPICVLEYHCARPSVHGLIESLREWTGQHPPGRRGLVRRRLRALAAPSVRHSHPGVRVTRASRRAGACTYIGQIGGRCEWPAGRSRATEESPDGRATPIAFTSRSSSDCRLLALAEQIGEARRLPASPWDSPGPSPEGSRAFTPPPFARALLHRLQGV
jgi:hypothetical protein